MKLSRQNTLKFVIFLEYGKWKTILRFKVFKIRQNLKHFTRSIHKTHNSEEWYFPMPCYNEYICCMFQKRGILVIHSRYGRRSTSFYDKHKHYIQ